MSLAELRLYSYGLDRSRGDVPIFATAAAEAAAGGGTGVTAPSLTFSNVKVRRDPYPQTIEVSIDASNMATLELCDTAVMKIGSVDRWYWITGYEEVTNSAYPNSSTNRMNVRISLEYIPVTTGLSLASTVDLIPERMPKRNSLIMQNWTDGIMIKTSASTPFPSLPKLPKIKHYNGLTPEKDQTMWCEINFSASGNLHKCGFFIFATGDGATSFGRNVQYDPSYISGTTYHYPMYPSLIEVIENSSRCLNVAASDIISIVVSEFCPYSSIVRTGDYIMRIGSGSEIAGTFAKSYTYTSGGVTYSLDYYVYDLTSQVMIKNNATLPTSETTVTLTLTDFEQCNGQLIIRDSMRNKVCAIPRELNAASMSFSVKTYSDVNNIYTVLKHDDITMTLPGYMVPWTASGWDYYNAYNLEYDRQALQNNIDMTNMQLATSATTSAATGAIGGAMLAGGAAGTAVGPGIGTVIGAAVGAGGAIAANMLSNYAKRKEQELTEQKMKNAPTTINNQAYGYGVCAYVDAYGGAEIILEMPKNLDSTEWGYQTALWGYPWDKLRINGQSLTAGYWKGRILNFTGTNNNTSTGELSDLMVRQFDNGLRLKQVS